MVAQDLHATQVVEDSQATIRNSGGADDSNDRGLKPDMPADQAGDHPKRTTDHWGSLAPAGRVEGAPRLVLSPTSHNTPVLIAISPPYIKQSTFFRLISATCKWPR